MYPFAYSEFQQKSCSPVGGLIKEDQIIKVNSSRVKAASDELYVNELIFHRLVLIDFL